MSSSLLPWVSSSVEHEVGNASESQGNGQVSSHAIARLRRSAIADEEDQRAQGNVSRSVHKEARECHVSVECVALACLFSPARDRLGFSTRILSTSRLCPRNSPRPNSFRFSINSSANLINWRRNAIVCESKYSAIATTVSAAYRSVGPIMLRIASAWV